MAGELGLRIWTQSTKLYEVITGSSGKPKMLVDGADYGGGAGTINDVIRVEMWHRDQTSYPQAIFDCVEGSKITISASSGSSQVSLHCKLLLTTILGLLDNTRLYKPDIKISKTADLFHNDGELRFNWHNYRGIKRLSSATLDQRPQYEGNRFKPHLYYADAIGLPDAIAERIFTSGTGVGERIYFSLRRTAAPSDNSSNGKLVPIYRCCSDRTTTKLKEDLELTFNLFRGGESTVSSLGNSTLTRQSVNSADAEWTFRFEQAQPVTLWDHIIRYNGRAKPDEDGLDWTISIVGLNDQAFSDAWEALVVGSQYAALRTVSDATSASFVPSLRPTDPATLGLRTWSFIVGVRDDTPRIRAAHKSIRRTSGTEFRSTQKEETTEFYITFGSLFDTNGDSLTTKGNIFDLTKGAATQDPAYDLFGTACSLEIKETSWNQVANLRLGALEFETKQDSLLQGYYTGDLSKYQITVYDAGAEQTPRPRAGQWVRIRGSLQIAAVRPAAQDPVPDDNRAPLGRSDREDLSNDYFEAIEKLFDRDSPVIIPLHNSVGRGSYLLRFAEESALDKDRTLQLNLLEGEPDPAIAALREDGNEPFGNVLVFDRHPFSIAELEVPSFKADQTGLSSTEIANWEISELEGRKWEIVGLAQGHQLRFQTSAVGEELEKGDHFYDRWSNASDDPQKKLRPIGTDEYFIDPSTNPPISPADNTYYGKTLDYRFSPPPSFSLRASYSEQRFVEPPWNVRRIMGYPGQRAPGAQINEFSFELLYGLPGAVRDVPGIRLADTESRLGGIVPRIPIHPPYPVGQMGKQLSSIVTASYRRHWERWARVTNSYRSRVAVYEPWAEGTTGRLRLTDGVSYRLDNSDLRAHPIDGDPQGRLKIGERALFGGADWGFESRNIYNEVSRNPKSTSGELRRPGFSALGGFGWLKAGFASDKTRIYADVELGRASFYSVERIGRIANLWNHAKHVIIYERTVVPSRQFRAQQPRHEGRPVVRKVQEYVEILEPVRQFPDVAGSSARRRGFILGCDFKSRIIPVDGTWGFDVRNEGWAIPLWRSDSDPQVYPKPKMNFQLAAAADSGVEFIAAHLEEPDKLYFYTDTTDGKTSETDLWPAVLDIDFCDEPDTLPAYLDPNAAIDGLGPERRLPDPPPIEGCERFTYRINVEGRPINIAQERAEDAILAELENLTFMRSSARQRASDPDGEKIINLFGEPTTDPDGETRPKNHVAAFVDEVNQTARMAINGLAADGPLDYAAAKSKIDSYLNTSNEFGDLKFLLNKKENKFQEEVFGAFGAVNFEELKKELNKQCMALEQAPAKYLNRRLAQFDTRLSAFRGKISEELRLLDLTKTETLLKSELRNLTETQILVLQGLMQPFTLGVEGALGEVAAFRQTIETLGKTSIAMLEEIVGEAERTSRLASQNLDEAMVAVGRLRSSLETHRRRSTELFGRVRKLLIKQSKGRYGKIANGVLHEIEVVEGVIFSTLTKVDSELGKVLSNGEPLDRQLKLVVQDAQVAAGQVAKEIASSSKVLTDAISNFEKEVSTALTRLTSWPDKLRSDLAAAIRDVDLSGSAAEKLKKIESDIGTVVDNVSKYINDIITDGANSLEKQATAAAEALCKQLFQELEAAEKLGKQLEDRLKQFVENDLKHLLPTGVSRSIEDVKLFFEDQLDDWQGEYSQIEERLKTHASQIRKDPLFQSGEAALRLMRGYGKGPILPQLKFNRNRLAYVFDDARDAILTSPAAAMVNDVGDVLNGIGLRVPTRELLDRIIPYDVEKVFMSKIGETLGGIKFLNMLSGIRMPAAAKDAIQVRHGLDKATQTAWLRASLEMPFGPATLFDFGPLNLKLQKAQISARSELRATLDDGLQQETGGELVGDWQLGFGGLNLVTFTRTAVRFDDSGGFKFDVSPDKIRLDRAIQWLSDLLQTLSDPDNGFIVEMIEENGAPKGVRASLDLQLPPIAGGAFAVSGLRLFAFMGLRHVSLPDGGSDFVISAGASLGRRNAPFSLMIAFLKGGGWIEARAEYATSSGKIGVGVIIGMTVGAGAEINFGPVGGMVSLEVGVFVEYFSNSVGQANGLSVGVMLLIRGRVVVFAIVTVGLSLLLTLTYAPNGSLTGRGFLSITVKVSRFWKIKVRKSVTYKLAKGRDGGGTNVRSRRNARKAVD